MIRKFYFFVALMLLSTVGFSQLQLTNKEFNTWEEYVMIKKKFVRPVDWVGCSNVSITKPFTFEMQAVFSEGDTVVHLASINAFIRVAPAMIAQAQFWNTANMSGAPADNDAGYYMNTAPAFTGRPESIKVKFKSKITTGDNIVVRVISWTGEEYEQSTSKAVGVPANNNKYVKDSNKVIDSRWTSTENYETWHEQIIPLTYKAGREGVAPSKINVVFSASNYDSDDFGGGAPKVGSILWLNEFSFIYPAKLKGVKIGNTELANVSSDVFTYAFMPESHLAGVPVVTAEAVLGGKVTIEQPKTVPGVAKITITSEDDLITNVYTVNISNKYNLVVTQGDNGTISPANVVVNHGASQEFTFTPDDQHSLDQIFIDEVAVAKVNTYMLSDITSNHTVRATFKYTPDMKNINFKSQAGVEFKVVPGYESPVELYGSFKFIVELLPSHNLSRIVVKSNGTELISYDGVYILKDITTTQNITVEGAVMNQYNISVVQSANGKISPDDNTTVEHGGSKTFTIKADAGYHIVDVLVNKESKGAIESLVLDNIATSYTITAVFAINRYSITVTQGEHGTISPSTTNVEHGTNRTFTITPKHGYQIETMLVDGIVVDKSSEYTFTNITANHTISATFSILIGVNDASESIANIYSYGMQIHIQTNENATVEIIDMAGRIINRTTIENSSSVITVEKGGVYVVKVISNNKTTQTEKVIVR